MAKASFAALTAFIRTSLANVKAFFSGGEGVGIQGAIRLAKNAYRLSLAESAATRIRARTDPSVSFVARNERVQRLGLPGVTGRRAGTRPVRFSGRSCHTKP